MIINTQLPERFKKINEKYEWKEIYEINPCKDLGTIEYNPRTKEFRCFKKDKFYSININNFKDLESFVRLKENISNKIPIGVHVEFLKSKKDSIYRTALRLFIIKRGY